MEDRSQIRGDGPLSIKVVEVHKAAILTLRRLRPSHDEHVDETEAFEDEDGQEKEAGGNDSEGQWLELDVVHPAAAHARDGKQAQAVGRSEDRHKVSASATASGTGVVVVWFCFCCGTLPATRHSHSVSCAVKVISDFMQFCDI